MGNVDTKNGIVIDDDTMVVMKGEREAPKTKIHNEKVWIAPTSLDTIEKRVTMLVDDLPSMEDTKSLSPTNTKELELWCRTMYKVKERFDLLKSFIEPAVYKWQTEHTGNSQQNVALLINEMHNTMSHLNEASSYCVQVVFPTLAVVSEKEITEESIGGQDTQSQEEDASSETTTATTSGSTATATTTTTTVSIDSPCKKHKTVVKHLIHNKVIQDPRALELHRELVCESAIDKRELMIFALSTAVKAFQDYRKAAANDVDARVSGMMM